MRTWTDVVSLSGDYLTTLAQQLCLRVAADPVEQWKAQLVRRAMCLLRELAKVGILLAPSFLWSGPSFSENSAAEHLPGDTCDKGLGRGIGER